MAFNTKGGKEIILDDNRGVKIVTFKVEVSDILI